MDRTGPQTSGEGRLAGRSRSSARGGRFVTQSWVVFKQRQASRVYLLRQAPNGMERNDGNGSRRNHRCLARIGRGRLANRGWRDKLSSQSTVHVVLLLCYAIIT